MSRAADIVDVLLEADPDDIDPQHYLSKVIVGSPDDVAKKLGFKDGILRVFLEHPHFQTVFDEPQPRSSNCVEITIRPDQYKTGNLDSYGNPEYVDDRYGFDWRRVVAFVPDGLSIMFSRRVIGGRSVPLADRLVHVVNFLIDAIKAEDGNHADLYAFAQAVDKRWGKQPNRIVRRKKKITP